MPPSGGAPSSGPLTMLPLSRSVWRFGSARTAKISETGASMTLLAESFLLVSTLRATRLRRHPHIASSARFDHPVGRLWSRDALGAGRRARRLPRHVPLLRRPGGAPARRGGGGGRRLPRGAVEAARRRRPARARHARGVRG